MEYLIITALFTAVFWPILFMEYSVDDNILEKKWRKKMSGPFYKFGLFKWDDGNAHEQKKRLTIKHRIWQFFHGAGMLNTAREEHLVNAGLHLITSCLIYRYTGILMAAVLYMVNPVTNQTALWINGRRYAVNALLIMVMLNFPVTEVPLYAIGCWNHITMVPFIVVSKYWWIMGPLFFLVGFKKIRHKIRSRKRDFISCHELQRIRPLKIVIVIKSIGFYVFHILFPNKPRMFHEYLYYFGRYEHENKRAYSLNFDFLKGLAGCALVAFEIWKFDTFWGLFFLALVLPWTGIYTVTMLVADRYAAIPAIAGMVILCQHIEALPPTYRAAAYTGFLVFYLIRYAPLFMAYRTIPELYKYHLAIQPDGVEARFHLAQMYLQSKKPCPWRAFAVVKDGIYYRPKDFKLHLMMGQVLMVMGFREKAVEILRKASPLVPLGEREYYEQEMAQLNQLLPADKRPDGGRAAARRRKQMQRQKEKEDKNSEKGCHDNIV